MSLHRRGWTIARSIKYISYLVWCWFHTYTFMLNIRYKYYNAVEEVYYQFQKLLKKCVMYYKDFPKLISLLLRIIFGYSWSLALYSYHHHFVYFLYEKFSFENFKKFRYYGWKVLQYFISPEISSKWNTDIFY